MLIEFRVENHRSLRDEQALTLEAGRRIGDPTDQRPREVAGHREKLLPAAVIYGGNASGKSNVLSALAFMHDAVVFSHRGWDPEGGVPRTAFAWGAKRNEPSVFEVSFLNDGVRFEYGFSVNDGVVEEEWLHAWPKNRKQEWFSREVDQFKFGEFLKGPNDIVKEVTRPNALFLSTAAQHGHEQLQPLYAWFHTIIPVNIAETLNRRYWESYFRAEREQVSSPEKASSTLSTRTLQLLKAADTGIVDVKIDVNETTREYPRRQILLQHQIDDDNSWLDLREESAGTKTLFRMAPSIFRALDSGGVLLIDELESSLHPLLGLAIVEMFNSPKTNPNNAQILFTTHDTNLLGTTLGEPPLRRDQVWFTEKDEDGASRLYPLTDYKPRKAENLERGYLQGRYGAIPFLGDIAWITE